MFKSLLNIFKNKKYDIVNDNKIIEEETTCEYDKYRKYENNQSIVPEHDIMMMIDYNKVPEPEIVNPDGKKVLLIMDDIQHVDLLLNSDYKRILTNHNVNVLEDYKIVKCYGNQAGFIAYKYSIINENKIDVALLDITLGHHIKLPNGYILELNGIDITVQLKIKYNDLIYKLLTAHTLNKSNSIINIYNKKLLDNLGVDLENTCISKNDVSRYELVYQLLYGGNYDSK